MFRHWCHWYFFLCILSYSVLHLTFNLFPPCFSLYYLILLYFFISLLSSFSSSPNLPFVLFLLLSSLIPLSALLYSTQAFYTYLWLLSYTSPTLYFLSLQPSPTLHPTHHSNLLFPLSPLSPTLQCVGCRDPAMRDRPYCPPCPPKWDRCTYEGVQAVRSSTAITRIIFKCKQLCVDKRRHS